MAHHYSSSTPVSSTLKRQSTPLLMLVGMGILCVLANTMGQLWFPMAQAAGGLNLLDARISPDTKIMVSPLNPNRFVIVNKEPNQSPKLSKRNDPYDSRTTLHRLPDKPRWLEACGLSINNDPNSRVSLRTSLNLAKIDATTQTPAQQNEPETNNNNSISNNNDNNNNSRNIDLKMSDKENTSKIPANDEIVKRSISYRDSKLKSLITSTNPQTITSSEPSSPISDRAQALTTTISEKDTILRHLYAKSQKLNWIAVDQLETIRNIRVIVEQLYSILYNVMDHTESSLQFYEQQANEQHSISTPGALYTTNNFSYWLPNVAELSFKEEEHRQHDKSSNHDSRDFFANSSHYIQFVSVGLEQMIVDASIRRVTGQDGDNVYRQLNELEKIWLDMLCVNYKFHNNLLEFAQIDDHYQEAQRKQKNNMKNFEEKNDTTIALSTNHKQQQSTSIDNSILRDIERCQRSLTNPKLTLKSPLLCVHPELASSGNTKNLMVKRDVMPDSERNVKNYKRDYEIIVRLRDFLDFYHKSVLLFSNENGEHETNSS